MDAGAADNKVGACGEGWGQQREVKGKCVAPPGTAWGTAGALSAPTQNGPSTKYARFPLWLSVYDIRSGSEVWTWS